jgi:hypothetical protein
VKYKPCQEAYCQALASALDVLLCDPFAAHSDAQGLQMRRLKVVVLEVEFEVGALRHRDVSWSEACRIVSEQLEHAGQALTGLATPCACNNPACINMSGPSELLLVNGRSCVCGGCKGDPLLLQGVSEAALASAQASVQGSSGSSKC